MNASHRTSRRQFLHTSIAATAGLTMIAPRRLWGANDRLNFASIGVGGMGAADLSSIARRPEVNVVALCDVDANTLAKAASKYPQAKLFRDFRKLFDEMGDSFDAVNVSTPDHTHAPAAMTALAHGKHVYCQKPLTHDVYESRQLAIVAHQKGLVTQMGIQIHSEPPYRRAVKIIRDGTLGKIREVHSWSGKKWGYAGPRPDPAPVPENLDWDLWIGTAPMRPFAPIAYHPANWRKWLDFGAGTMGDMGIHILDPVANALKLGAPRTIVSSSDVPPPESFALDNRVEYTFAGTDLLTDGFKLTWYDGDQRPDTSAWPVADVRMPDQGSMFVGEKGYMLLPHVGEPVLLPRDAFDGYTPPQVEDGDHWDQWVSACLGTGQTTAGFDYAGPLTETLLLGVIANRFPTQALEWDAERLQFTNFGEANKLLRRTYREGFEVPGLSG